MGLFSPLSYWLDKKREIPLFKHYESVTPDFELGFFLGLDICKPLHKVLEVSTQSLVKSWFETNKYIQDVLEILEEDYGEDLDDISEDGVIDLDKEQVFFIKEKLGDPPTHCYPIYLFTVGTGSEERLVYVGKTSSKTKRFSGGHRAALELHNPKYNGLEKKVYFGCIVFLENHEYLPLEWIHPLNTALHLLDSVESGLIYYFSPELNIKKTKKNYSGIPINLHIQNFSGVSKFLHDTFIYL